MTEGRWKNCNKNEHIRLNMYAHIVAEWKTVFFQISRTHTTWIITIYIWNSLIHFDFDWKLGQCTYTQPHTHTKRRKVICQLNNLSCCEHDSNKILLSPFFTHFFQSRNTATTHTQRQNKQAYKQTNGIKSNCINCLSNCVYMCLEMELPDKMIIWLFACLLGWLYLCIFFFYLFFLELYALSRSNWIGIWLMLLCCIPQSWIVLHNLHRVRELSNL